MTSLALDATKKARRYNYDGEEMLKLFCKIERIPTPEQTCSRINLTLDIY